MLINNLYISYGGHAANLLKYTACNMYFIVEKVFCVNKTINILFEMVGHTVNLLKYTPCMFITVIKVIYFSRVDTLLIQ